MILYQQFHSTKPNWLLSILSAKAFSHTVTDFCINLQSSKWQSSAARHGHLERWDCREFNQNLNLWETKQIKKTHVKENNHTHKTIFMWFGNLPMSTELQGFHYYQEKIKNTTCGYNISLSPTRQENTILSSYMAARLLGIISNYFSQLALYHKPNIYIYIS